MTPEDVSRYTAPKQWIRYDAAAVFDPVNGLQQPRRGFGTFTLQIGRKTILCNGNTR